MKQIGLIIFISITLLTGCTHTVRCSNDYVTPAFVGFKLSDLDTLIIREYKKDDNFFALLDTAVIITDSAILSRCSSNDTTIVLLNHISGEEKYIFPDHDWQIYIPAQNMVVSMSSFDSPQKYQKCVLGGDLCRECSNPINFFLQNGQQTTPKIGQIPFWGNGYLTYIHR
jgi:hypothetical protein